MNKTITYYVNGYGKYDYADIPEGITANDCINALWLAYDHIATHYTAFKHAGLTDKIFAKIKAVEELINEQETNQQNETTAPPVETNPAGDTGKHQAIEVQTHTPGPWKVTNHILAEVRCSCEPGSDKIISCSPSVATIHDNNIYPHTNGKQMANAHLMSAAPEMLDLLESYYYGYPVNELEVITTIKKARGAEPCIKE